MERAPGRTFDAGWQDLLGRRVVLQYLPMAAFALAAFLIFRNLAGGDAPTSPLATVDSGHSQRLAANITFFEGRVAETHDSLSYNRLTGLYLQRVRETGDVSDVRRAELSATKSLEAAPGDYAGLTNLALVRIAQHDFESAATLAREASSLIPTRTDANAILGDAQIALGQYDAATANYRLFLEKNPGSSAFSRQASLAELQGNLPLAEQFWEAAIDADRNDVPENSAWARVQLANLYFVTGRLNEARTASEAALKVFPGYPAALAAAARVAAATGDDAEAIRLFSEATARIPVPDYVAALGDLYQRAGRSVDAQRQYALVGAIEQLFVANGVRSDLTLILFALDHGADLSATLERTRQAYAERPSIAAADVHAWALYRAGAFDEARTRSNEALHLGTRDPSFLFHAGMIANAQGDTAAARDYLGRALALNPRFSILHAEEAARTLAALRGGR